MKLSLVSESNGTARVNCEGEITLADFQGATNPFLESLGPNAFSKAVLVNMEDSIVIDSAGIGWLIMSQQRFQNAGGKLALHSIPPLVDHVLSLLKMPKVLHLAADETAALAMLQGG